MPTPSKKKNLPRPHADLDVEISFLEGLVQRDPNYVEALQILGDAYTKRGDYEKGLKIDQLLAALRPDDSLVLYNLACSLALTGKIDDAFGALERAVQNGYRDIGWMKKDKDLESLRKDLRFRELIAAISRPPR